MRIYLHANSGAIAFDGYDLRGLTDIRVTIITRENFKFILAITKSCPRMGMYAQTVDELY